MLHKDILEDLSKDCPCNGNDKWCFWRDVIQNLMDDRTAEQIRLIYDYKFLKSQEEGADIGKERACKEFIEKYAKRFNEVYKKGMKHKELFKLIFKEP